MGRTKQKTVTAVAEVGKVKKDEEHWSHGEFRDIPMELIEPNPWNPNVMSADEFNMLAENVEDVKFLDPILVVPLPRKDGDVQRYRIVDCEHRWEQQRLMDADTIKCIIADPEIFDEKEQKRQTVRMNKIRGSLDTKKFSALVNDLMTTHEVPYDEVARELGFVDETEFDRLMQAARDSLPTNEMKKEFDAAKEEVKTVDDLTLLLNRLFTKYGDTLPANFMILDFGGKEHIWVRMQKNQFKKIMQNARVCLEKGITFDSVISHSLTLMDVDAFITEHADLLEKVPDEPATIDDLTG